MGMELITGIAIGCCISASIGALFFWLKFSVVKQAEKMIQEKKTK